MKVRVRVEKVNLWLPVPLFLGTLAIRFGLKGRVNDEERMFILNSFKVCKKHLKAYKGMKIVEIQTSTGEYISVTL